MDEWLGTEVVDEGVIGTLEADSDKMPTERIEEEEYEDQVESVDAIRRNVDFAPGWKRPKWSDLWRGGVGSRLTGVLGIHMGVA